jgi:hypothetical protein
MTNKSPTKRRTYKETNQLTNRPPDWHFFAHNQKVGCGYFFLIKFVPGTENTLTKNHCKNNNKWGIFFFANKIGKKRYLEADVRRHEGIQSRSYEFV